MIEPRTDPGDLRRPRRVDRILPPVIFGGLVLSLVALFAVRDPAWGLMDDPSLLATSRSIVASDSALAALAGQSVDDLTGWGIFRPVYWLWVSIVYSIFASWPVGAYLATVAFNSMALLIWGAAFVSVFDLKGRWTRRGVFSLPLLAFAFPPYWNIYQYVSLQEKFIVFFSGIAVLAFSKSSRRGGGRVWNAIGFAAIVLGLMSKPTMVALPLAILAVLALRAVMGDRVRPSGLWAGFAFVTVGLYLVFTLAVQTRGAYTATYSESLGVAELLRSAAAAPRSVLALAIFALVAFSASFHRQSRAVTGRLGLEAVLPVSLLAYLVVLLPWGFPTYLLSGLTPFVVGSALIILLRVGGRLERSCPRVPRLHELSSDALVLGLLLVMIPLDVAPKTAWLADVREVQEFLSASAPNESYFFPPPFVEHAGSLSALTGRDVRYLGDGAISSVEIAGSGSYLISYLDQSPVVLDHVALGEAVFGNGTWTIHPVMVSEDAGQQTFAPVFPEAPLPLGRRIRQFLG